MIDIGKINSWKKEFQTKYKNWEKLAKEANSFVRGSHFESEVTDVTGRDQSPEELGGNKRVYPNVPYLPSRIDRAVQFIRSDEASPAVEPEEPFDFTGIPADHPYNMIKPALVQALGDITDNELTARLLTARLDLFSDRANMTEILDEVLEIAAQERICVTLVEWHEDETTREPVKVTPLDVGDFGFDPNANKIEEGRFCWYVERDIPRSVVAERYKKKVSDLPGGSKGAGEADDGETVYDENLVDVEHWWIKDTTTKTVKAEIEIEGGAIEAEEEDVYKYRGGWRYVCVTGNQVLKDGSSETPCNGRPPMVIMPWRKMPRTIVGMSMYDLTKDFNKSMDRLQQYGLEASYKQQPKTLVDPSKVANVDELMQNTVGGFVILEPTEDGKTSSLGGMVQYLPGGNPPGGVLEMYDRIKASADEFCGTEGVAIEDATKTKLSGDAIEGLAQDRDGVLGRVKDRYYWFKRDLYRLILGYIIQNQESEMSVPLEVNGTTVYIKTSFKMFGFDEYDFEPRFDIVVAAPRNMPRNPVRRSQYLRQLLGDVSQLAATDPVMARMYVDVADLPNKPKLYEYLQQREAMAAQQAAPANDALAKADADALKAEKEAELAVRKRAAESVIDSFERIATEVAKVDPVKAAELAARIPQIAMEAWNATPAMAQPMPTNVPDAAMPLDGTGAMI